MARARKTPTPAPIAPALPAGQYIVNGRIFWKRPGEIALWEVCEISFGSFRAIAVLFAGDLRWVCADNISVLADEGLTLGQLEGVFPGIDTRKNPARW